MYRIRKHKKGYVVEVQQRTWYGRKVWSPFVTVSGIKTMPWYHSSYKYAEMNMIDQIKREVFDEHCKNNQNIVVSPK